MQNKGYNSTNLVQNTLLDGSIQLESLEDSDILTLIAQKIAEENTAMENTHTAKLWLQYLDIVEILLTFTKAVRIGNWSLHVKVNCNMLPFLAAAGHNNYAKSLYLYIQNKHT